MSNKQTTRQFGKAQGQDSPKSTVKVAPVDKGKESYSLFESATREKKAVDAEAESTKFREEIKSMISNMDQKISTRLQALDEKVSNIFRDVKEEIAGLRNEVSENTANTTRIASQVNEIEKGLEFQSQTVQDIERKQEENLSKIRSEIDEKVQQLNQKLSMLEKQDRKYNLLFYGIPEERGENIFQKMRHLFESDLGIDSSTVENMYFSHGHRMPTEVSDGPKPIILRFASFGDRDLVLSLSYKLAGSKRRILADLPVFMKKERGRLAKVAYNIRQSEKMQTRIRDKGLAVFLEVRKNKEDQWVRRDV